MRVYIDSGERKHSGTGRNRQSTTFVTQLNIMDALPSSPLRAPSLGEAMEPAHSSMGHLYRQTSGYWCYSSTFDESEDFRPLLRVRGTTKITAARGDYEGGTVILLPILLTGTWDDEDGDEGHDADDGGDDREDDSQETSGSDIVESTELLADKLSDDDELDSDTVDKMVLD